LEDDPGESRNLAAKHPEVVSRLNALIYRHLEETQALAPAKSPDYRPSFLGWTGNLNTSLSRADDCLRIQCSGADPWIVAVNPPRGQGKLAVELRMCSNARGEAALYFATQAEPQFARERRVILPVVHDGQWPTY